MNQLLRDKIIAVYHNTVNTAKDCDLLSQSIYLVTRRKISSTTLRRFFGLLPSKSNVSKYNMDTLAIYCGKADYDDFVDAHATKQTRKLRTEEISMAKIEQITQYTLNSIAKKTLGKFEHTLPRKEINARLNDFLKSSYAIYPIIAPGGYGKSIALAHWVKSIDTQQYDYLFCTAALFYQLISSDTNVNYSVNLNVDSDADFFTLQLPENKPFIFIIDSIDVISSNTKKYEKLLDYIIKISSSVSIKVIFSIRESSWTTMMKHDLKKRYDEKELYNVIYDIESGFSNFPILSLTEINQLIHIYNKSHKITLQYNAFPFLVQNMARIPINFYYLFSLLQKYPSIAFINVCSLNKLYIREFVFNSKYAEYKEDILWKIIELIENKGDTFFINKNQLKDCFPIHLKRETEFYHAYKELIDIGILYEERLEGNYYIFKTNVGFKHQNLYYFLSALNQIQKHNRLDYTLLEKICASDKSFEWKSNVVSILYEAAYEDENFSILERLCDLPQPILSSLPVRFSVGNSFRVQNAIRDQLIKKYASYKIGQVSFFEQFVDTNFMFNNYEYRIKQYLKHKQTKEAQLFGNSILFLSGFLKMDVEICSKHFEITDSIEPDKTIDPWPMGRKVSCKILYSYFIEKKPIKNTSDFILKYQNIAYSQQDYLSHGLVTFELTILVALLLVEEYEIIISLEEKIAETYNIDHSDDDFFKALTNNQNILPYLFSRYADYKLNQKMTIDLATKLEKTIDNFPSTYDDFQYKILLKYFLFDILKDYDIEKANEYFKLALDLSTFAQYDFYTAFLLVKNPTNDDELIAKGNEMFKKLRFDI